jgi:uncharacterized membrane protein YdjX (TVP38/TMEM64 family)
MVSRCVSVKGKGPGHVDPRRARAYYQAMNETTNTSPVEQPDSGTRRGPAWVRPLVLAAVLAAVIVLARVLGLGDRLGAAREWIRALGPWGGVVFILLFAAGTVAAIPGSALTIAAGALFGSVWGFVVVNIGATLGAALAFLVSRYFARDAVARWVSGSERFRRLDRLTEEHGSIIVAITRLVPLFPFNLLNYGFGLTRVSFGTYLLWTWLCIIPGDFLYIAGADAVTQGITGGRVPWALLGALALAALLLTVLVRAARRRLGGQGKEQP